MNRPPWLFARDRQPREVPRCRGQRVRSRRCVRGHSLSASHKGRPRKLVSVRDVSHGANRRTPANRHADHLRCDCPLRLDDDVVVYDDNTFGILLEQATTLRFDAADAVDLLLETLVNVAATEEVE